jgi:exo-1,4-beta-D-glucosaminidase
MLNDAWPTLYWHLYDYNLAPAGSYFGTKAGLRPLHVQYSYDHQSVVLVNGGRNDVPGLWVQTTVFNLDGAVKADDRVIGRTAKANASTRVADVPTLAGLSKTYFVRLLVGDGAGRVLDRNVYWLSTQADTLNYGGSTWYHTPQSGYADLTGLNGLSPATVSARAASAAIGDRVATTATLTNTTGGSKVAFFVRTSVRKGPGGAEVLPVTWTDNYVTLWPGEAVTLRSDYRRADLGGVTPSVQVSGWNIPTTEVPAAF